MPTWVIMQRLCSKVDDTVCTTAVLQSLAVGLCLYNEKHCHASAVLWISVILQNRALMQTLMNKLIRLYLFCRGY